MGLGRPGTLHAFDHDGVVPDIVTFGKVLGGGLPLSAAVGPAEILDEPAGGGAADHRGQSGVHGGGSGGAGHHRRRAAGRARGESRCGCCPDALRALAGSPGADRIGDVRGRGLAIGLELVDPQTGRP